MWGACRSPISLGVCGSILDSSWVIEKLFIEALVSALHRSAFPETHLGCMPQHLETASSVTTERSLIDRLLLPSSKSDHIGWLFTFVVTKILLKIKTICH